MRVRVRVRVSPGLRVWVAAAQAWNDGIKTKLENRLA